MLRIKQLELNADLFGYIEDQRLEHGKLTCLIEDESTECAQLAVCL